MRNLKRALSLTLASVMLLGMMVVGAGAAGFPDVDEDNANIEAIEVLQAVEVMIGDDNGNFGPNDPVNRSQMAVVMAKLLNLDYQYYEASCPFWDVPTWARPYVGACYANKIVSGYGDGTYGAADGVTPVQAASMMMRALGYFQHSEDYQDGFETATVRQGTEVGIFEGVGSSATANMTRAQVARMALNALESEMVTFTGVPGVTVGDATIGYRAEYTPRTSTETKYQAIEKRTSDVSGGNNLNRGQYYIQLGEELYNGKLTKKYDTDDFERPSINWQFNGKEIGVYVDYDLLVAGGSFTNAVKYSELYNLLTFTTINDNSLYRYVDGVDQKESKDKFSRSNKDEVGGTGVLTEVFYNQDREEITITSINTYLAKANSDYNKTNETLSLKVYETNGTGTTKIVDSEDVEEAAGVAKDDFRLVYMSGKNNAAKLEVVKIFDVEIMTGSQITKWSKHDTKVVDKLTTEGTEYKTNPKAYYDKNGDVLLAYNEQRLTDTSYNIFMDRYNNVIGVDLYEGTKNYVFITGYDRIQSNISVKTADAAAIFMDGTMDIVTVNVTDTDKNIRKADSNNYIEWSQYSYEGVRDLNRWYTYTQAANGNYTLKPVDRFFYTSYYDGRNNTTDDFDTKGVKVLNTANLYLNDSNKTDGYNNKGRIYGNDDSVYITVEPGYVDTSKPTGSHDAITDVKGVYTGAQDVKLEITTTSKELVNERKGEDHTTSVYPNTSVDYTKVDYDKWNAPYEQNAYVYSIYDSNYYIIASVVLGDAQGATANYAYILDDAKSEWVEHGSSSRSTSDDTYFWEFEAVLNGEKQTLTVKSKYEDTIDDLRPYHMQELRFDGDYVTAIKDVDSDKVMITNTDEWKTDEYDVYDVGHTTTAVAQAAWADSQNIHTAMSDRDIHSGSGEYTHSNHRIDGTIELVGRTLYTERPHDVGLALTNDAKAVLIQKENKSVETIQCDSVAEAIGRLADADTRDIPAADGIQFHGRIVAVLDSAGAAKWVVIISDTLLLTGNQPSYGDTSDLRWVQYNEITGTGRYWELYIPGYVDATTVSSETIRNALASNGCSDISRNGSNWNFYRNGTRYENQVVRVVTTYWGDDTIHVTGVTLDKATATVKAGEKVTLVATVAPSNATNKAVTWTSSDNTVATVSNGVVTGVKAGTATITVTTADRGYTDSCAVTVTEEGKVVPATLSLGMTRGYVNVTKGDEILTVNGGAVATLVDDYTLNTQDVITIAPAEVFDVTGATENADGTWTVTGNVTITPKAGYQWHPFFYQWQDQDGILTQTSWNEAPASLASMILSPLARIRTIVRAADDGLVNDGEEELNWKTDINWFVKALQTNEYIELRVIINNVIVSQKVEVVDGKMKVSFKENEGGITESDFLDYIAKPENMDTVVAVGVGEPVKPVSDIVTLDTPKAAEVTINSKTVKVADIQSNIKVAYDKETKTFKVTGDLTYQKKLEAYSSNTNKNVGYFVALDLGWAEADRGAYKVQISEIDNGVEKWKNDDLAENNAARTEVILGRVADGTGKMIGNRSIKVTNDFLGTQEIYTIDLSGLKCITPELLKITAVEKEDASTGLGAKKISDIQTGVKVSVDEAAKTVKLTGTLHPVTTAWTDWSSNGNENTGYYAAIYLDASSMTNTNMTIYNPNSVGAAGGKQLTLEDGKDTLIIRVASLSEKLTGAPEAGKDATIVVSNASSAEKMVTYTLDFSGLTLERQGSGDAKVSETTEKTLGDAFGNMNPASFQENVKVTKAGDTFKISGDLTPVKFNQGWNENMTKGYYVCFDIDVSDVTGAAAWAVRGNAGGNAPGKKDTFVFFLGGTDLEKADIKTHTLYVLNAVATESTIDDDKVLKTYTLDFSGVTLLEAEPFTVTARSTGVEDANVHQELLCDMDSYKVTVDHKNKKIVVTGDLYAISEVYTPWAYGELKTVMGTKADSEGYFVTFQVDKSSLEENFAFKTEGVDKKNNGTDTTESSGVIVRVAKTGATENAAGRLLLKTGENEYETYEFDLTGVTFKLSSDRTEPAKPNAGGQA